MWKGNHRIDVPHSGKCIGGVVRMFLKNRMTGAMGFPRDGRRKQEKKNIHRNRAVLWIDP